MAKQLLTAVVNRIKTVRGDMQFIVNKTNRWLNVLLDNFDPVTTLWRSLELGEIQSFLDTKPFTEPVLDLGCGEGNIARVLFRNKFNFLTGLDLLEEALFIAQNTHNYKYLLVSDATRMPFKSQVFNSVFSNSVIEHIPNLDVLLKEIYYILKPKGLVLFTVPTDKFGEGLFFYRLLNKLSLKKLADWYKNKRISLLQHFNLYSPDEWSEKLNDTGLNIIFSKSYISKNTLSCWDLIAAVQFVWCRIFPNAKTLPFRKAFIPLIKFIYRKFEFSGNQIKTAILIVAEKAQKHG